MRLDLSTLRAPRVPGQTEAPTAAGPEKHACGRRRFVLRVPAAAINVVWASRRPFDRFDDFDDPMSALRPPQALRSRVPQYRP